MVRLVLVCLALRSVLDGINDLGHLDGQSVNKIANRVRSLVQ